MNDYLLITVACLFGLLEAKMPMGKEQQEVWRVECELGLILDPECPIDGEWAPWSPWSACTGPCDEIGRRHRGRECNNPASSQGGRPCLGSDQEFEPCYITNCTVEDYRKLIEGDPIRKEALKELEAVPTLMEQCLQIECPFEGIEVALASDNTWQISSESLWNSLQCVKHNLGCPLVGQWSSWSEWTPCGARCGYGLRWRFRRCNNPPPSNEHLICSGSPLQVDECQGDQCAINNRDSGGKWGEWEKWSSCSEKCGVGIKRRKRVCYEMNTPRLFFSSWGTHCRGQHDQIELCENKECKLKGGWSGWSSWGPCSQSCGIGRRSRVRTCTNPEPAGNGEYCSGPRNEFSHCILVPCETFSHTVVVFNGDSFLKYDFGKKRSTLFHFYARFLPLAPHGSLVRRGNVDSPLVKLSLHRWHLCLDASGTSRACTIPRLCTRGGIEPAVWHTVLITVTSESTSMRVDDESISLKNPFACDPELPNAKMNIVVGEGLHGEIQELILNFVPLCMVVNRDRVGKYAFCPTAASDIIYEKAGINEAYLKLDNDAYLRLPCFEDQDNWYINLTLKTKTTTGTIIFLQNHFAKSWLHLYLQNMRLKLKLSLADLRSESLSSSDCTTNQWFDVTLSKKRGINLIEASINAGERLYVFFEENFARQSRNQNSSHTNMKYGSTIYKFCTDEYFIGGVPANVKDNIVFEDFNYLSALIATLSVNDEYQDLREFTVERLINNHIQISSRTASVSGSYHETAWGKSNSLNLTCLHARSIRSPNSAYWFYLDTILYGLHQDKKVRSIDDGRVLRLVAAANNELKGFYTCRVHSARRTRNIVTYGVIGQINHTLTDPDLTTAIAVVTTLVLVLSTLACLFIEGFHDIRNGYGFYRDAHLGPEEEAEAVCKYIDENMHLMASKSAAEVAKANARRLGRQLCCHSHSSSEEPQDIMLVESLALSNDSMPSEPKSLPALPEVKSSNLEDIHSAFKCELSYVSSPRHGSISSPKSNFTSSSEATSPRLLCSRLLLGKRLTCPKDIFKKNKPSRVLKTRSKLFTIKSSTYNMCQSPGQKVLEKFRSLKSED